MASHVIRRVLWTLPILLLASLLTFLLVAAIPYDPFDNPKLAPSVRAQLERQHGIDQPLHVRYGQFVADLARGDLGRSTKPGGHRVADVIRDKLPTSLLLGTLAFAFAAVVGTLLGIVSALRANGHLDHAITLVSTAAFALPSFVVATLWVKYNRTTGFYGWETWPQRIGPIIVLGISLMPYFVRLVRASMLESLQQDWVLTATAKGLPWRVTVFRHLLRNSLIPTVTNAGPLFGFVLTGSFIIERIMIVPGIANEFVRAFQQPLDPRMVLATTLLLATVIIVLNLIVDIVVAWLDPRVSHG